MFNLPNVLTLSRIALIPVFVGVYYLEWRYSHMLAAGIFAFAAITDWVDGYLARRMGLVTPFGAFLDPVADKMNNTKYKKFRDDLRESELVKGKLYAEQKSAVKRKLMDNGCAMTKIDFYCG